MGNEFVSSLQPILPYFEDSYSQSLSFPEGALQFPQPFPVLTILA